MKDEGPRANILMVDDDPAKLLMLEAVLGDLGHNLVKATSGQEALRQLLRQDFAAILLDIRMPGMDGFETAALIRRRPRSRHTPILFVSAVDESEWHMHKGYELDQVEYLPAPLVMADLRARINRYIQQFREALSSESAEMPEQPPTITPAATNGHGAANRARAPSRRTKRNQATGREVTTREVTGTFRSAGHLEPPRLDRFFTLSTELLAIADADDYFQHLNPQWSKTLGLPEAELRAQPWTELLHPEDRLAWSECLPERVSSLESRWRCQDGSYKWLRWTATAVPDEGVLYLVAQERPESQSAPGASAAAIARLLSGLGHELRTPLNAVIGYTGTLLMRLPGPLTEDQEQQLRAIQAGARNLLTVINQVVEVAKIEFGQFEYELEPVLCQDVLARVGPSIQSRAQSKGLRFETQAPEQDLVVLADRRALIQILNNLADNALKFTDQGCIRLDLRRHQEQEVSLAEITITDTGIGIKPEDQPKLFEPFTHIGDANARERAGAGLGLHLSQKLAQLLHGSITCSSEYGRGSTFTVTLVERR